LQEEVARIENNENKEHLELLQKEFLCVGFPFVIDDSHQAGIFEELISVGRF
jgi:hypothetical protein